MKVPTPNGVDLKRLISVRDLEWYGAATDDDRLEARAYLRSAVRESTPGSARAMMSVVAGIFGVGVSFLVLLVGLTDDDPQARNDSLLLLGIVTLLLLVLGGATLGFAWREDRRNAIATGWLAEIEAVEARMASRGAVAAAPPDALPSTESPRRSRRSRLASRSSK